MRLGEVLLGRARFCEVEVRSCEVGRRPVWSGEVLRGRARSCRVRRGWTRSFEVGRGPERSGEVLRGRSRSREVGRGPASSDEVPRGRASSLRSGEVPRGKARFCKVGRGPVRSGEVPRYYQHLKRDFWSIPYKNFSTNLGLDAVREEEHKTAKLLFTKGSSLETIMEHLLRLNEMEAMVKVSNIFISRQIASNDASNHAMWSYHKDHRYFMPTVTMVLRRQGLCLQPEMNPHNVYSEV